MGSIDRHLPAWTGARWEQVTAPVQACLHQASDGVALRLFLEALQAEMADLAELAMPWLAEEWDPLSGLPVAPRAPRSPQPGPSSGAPGRLRSDAESSSVREQVDLAGDALARAGRLANSPRSLSFGQRPAGVAETPAHTAMPAPCASAAAQRPSVEAGAPPLPENMPSSSNRGAAIQAGPARSEQRLRPAGSAGPAIHGEGIRPGPAGSGPESIALGDEPGRLLAMAHPAGETSSGSSHTPRSGTTAASLTPRSQRLAELTERWLARYQGGDREVAVRQTTFEERWSAASSPPRSSSDAPAGGGRAGLVIVPGPAEASLIRWIARRVESPSHAALLAAAQSPVGAAAGAPMDHDAPPGDRSPGAGAGIPSSQLASLAGLVQPGAPATSGAPTTAPARSKVETRGDETLVSADAAAEAAGALAPSAAGSGSTQGLVQSTARGDAAPLPAVDLLGRLTDRWFRSRQTPAGAGQAAGLSHPWLGSGPEPASPTPRSRESGPGRDSLSWPATADQPPVAAGRRSPMVVETPESGAIPPIQLNVQPPALEQLDPDALADLLGQVLRREARRHGIPMF